MRPGDIAELLKALAQDVRELVGESSAALDARIEAVGKRLDDLPAPAPAPDLHALGDLVEKGIVPVIARLQELEARPPAAGEKGDRGDAGADGKDGKDGTDGKSVDVEAIQRMIDEAVATKLAAAIAALPAPTPGRDGADGTDGKDAVPVDEAAIVARTALAVLERLPAPVPGRDGMDGRDALQVEVLGGIDGGKSYPRGTFAEWGGGMLRAARATDAVGDTFGAPELAAAGWAVVLNGVSALEARATGSPRRFQVACRATDGTESTLEMQLPVPLWQGIWREARDYEQGDMVTWDGSLWHCERATRLKPGMPASAEDWKLCAKRGTNGRDGDKGDKGDKGNPGKDGRDLTQMGPDGSRY